MIVILIKDKKNKLYSTTSFNQKLEKEIDGNPSDNSAILKSLAKEFSVPIERIHKYWNVK